MKTTDIPSKMPVPFANGGQRTEILSSTISGSNRASYPDGFPPITMIDESAGGTPPLGQNFNQILFELSSAMRWTNAGGNYSFDDTFSSSVGGYPDGSVLINSSGDGLWVNTIDGNTNNPESVSATPLTGWVPLVSYGSTIKTGISSSSITLSTLEASRNKIIISGVLKANINLIMPLWVKTWLIVNNCTGSFSVTVKGVSGTGVVLVNGAEHEVYSDGVNIVQGSKYIIGPTAPLGTNSTQLATTAFVNASLIDINAKELSVSDKSSFSGKVDFTGNDYLDKKSVVSVPADGSNQTLGLRLEGANGQRSDDLFYEAIGTYAARRFVVISGGNTITYDMRQDGSLVCLNPTAPWGILPNGDLYGSKWGGNISDFINRNFITDSRIGSPTTLYKDSGKNVFTCPSGYVFSSIDTGDVGSVTATARPIQKKINGNWITVSQL